MLANTLEEFENEILAGCDEVARGSSVSCVCASCVIWDKNYTPETKDDEKLLNMIKDSKKLSEKNRERLAEFIKKHAVAYGIGIVSNQEIDKINILQATFKAMHLALDQIKMPYDRIVVDGDKFKPYIRKNSNGDEDDDDLCFVPHKCIPKGDNSLLQIAAASILAKVHRDKIITDLHHSDPRLQVYHWDKNKGYLTKQHIEAIKQYGMCEHHRKTFIHFL
jgi:ribonuclease HII